MFRLHLGFGFLKNPVDTYRDSTRPWIYKVVPVAVEETKNGWQNCFVVVSVGFDVNARMIAQVVFFSSVHFHPLPEVWGWNSICFAGCLAEGDDGDSPVSLPLLSHFPTWAHSNSIIFRFVDLTNLLEKSSRKYECESGITVCLLMSLVDRGLDGSMDE